MPEGAFDWTKPVLIDLALEIVDLGKSLKRLHTVKSKDGQGDVEIKKILKAIGFDSADALRSHIEKLKDPADWMSKEEKNWKLSAISWAEQAVKNAETAMYDSKRRALIKMIADSVEFSEAVKDEADLKWQLDLNYSQERKDQLSKYISEHRTHELAAIEELNKQFDDKEKEVPLPDGYESFEELEKAIQYIMDIRRDRFVPEGDAHDEIQALLNGYLKLKDESDSLQEPVLQLRTQIKDYRDLRSAAVGIVDYHYTMITELLESEDPKRSTLPKKLLASYDESEVKLVTWIELNSQIDEIQSEHLLKAKLSGASIDDAIKSYPHAYHELLEKFIVAQDEYGKLRDQVRVVWLKLVLDNKMPAELPKFSDKDANIENVASLVSLFGRSYPTSASDQLSQAALKLFGEGYFEKGKPSDDSIEGILDRISDDYNSGHSISEKINREAQILNKKYLDRLAEVSSENAYASIASYNIGELLNLDFDELYRMGTVGPEARDIRLAIINSIVSWKKKWKVTAGKDADYKEPEWNPEPAYINRLVNEQNAE